MRHLTQEELIVACLDHREDAWQEFLRRYGDLIYSTILKVGLTPEDQEESFQSTIVALYRHLPRLRDREKLVSWMIGVAWRQAINRIRERTRAGRISGGPRAAAGAETEIPSSTPGVEETRLHLERAQWTREALDQMPERCRRLLSLLFYENPPLDYQEIAHREGIPIGSLGPTRARCLQKMKRIFEERGWKL